MAEYTEIIKIIYVLLYIEFVDLRVVNTYIFLIKLIIIYIRFD